MVSGYASPAAVVGVTIAFTAIAAIAVLLRIFTRLRLAHNGGVDDIFIAVAGILIIGLAICTCIEVHYGVSKHTADLTVGATVAYLKGLWVSIILYNLAMFCTKYSILLQYLRIFPQKRFRIACFALMGIVLAYCFWCFFSAVFLCRPVQAYWTLALRPKAHCLNDEIVWFANAGINIVTDIATAILPIPMLNQLNIPKRQKYALMAVFALGGFTCIVSVLRLESIYAITNSAEQSWNNGQAALWSVIEIATGIVCSCLPTLKALVTHISPKIFHTSNQRSHDTAYAQAHGMPVPTRSKMSHDQLGRGLSGKHKPQQKSYISRGSRHSMDVGLQDLATSPRRIKVVTVVDQEVDRGLDGKSDHGSTRNLVRRGSDSD